MTKYFNRLHLGLPLGIATLLLGAGNALAAGTPPPAATSSPQPPSTGQTIHLKKIIVNGHKVPLPIVLNMIKAGLSLSTKSEAVSAPIASAHKEYQSRPSCIARLALG